MHELVNLHEVVGVHVERYFIAVAIVFGRQEELDKNGLGNFALDMYSYFIFLVVQPWVLYHHAHLVVQFLGCKKYNV